MQGQVRGRHPLTFLEECNDFDKDNALIPNPLKFLGDLPSASLGSGSDPTRCVQPSLNIFAFYPLKIAPWGPSSCGFWFQFLHSSSLRKCTAAFKRSERN